MHLLDVNVLIALCDADHVHRSLVADWFRQQSRLGWATCPLTENALLRVMGQSAYPGGPGNPHAIRPLLQHLRSLPGHQFWEDNISLADSNRIPSMEGITSKKLTDLYLLALAVHRNARFVTLDQRINPTLVNGGTQALTLIGSGTNPAYS